MLDFGSRACRIGFHLVVLALAVIVLDLATKHLASALLDYARPVPVLPFFNLTLLHNPGAAFSFLAGHDGWQRWFFTGLGTVAALQAGDLACGFFHPDAPSPGLETRVLLRERNGILLSAADPLARRRTLRLRELAETPFVLFPRQHNPGFYDRILAAFAEAGVSPKITEARNLF